MKKITIINLLTTGILLLLSGILISILLPLKIIPLKYLLPTLALYSVLLMITIYETIKKKQSKKKRILTIILSLLLIIILGITSYYLNSTLTFMKNTQTKNYQIEEYYVLVLTDSSYQTLSDIENQTIAIYSNTSKEYSSNLEKLKQEVSLQEKLYFNYLESMEALLNKEVESLFISSTYKNMAEEEIERLPEKVRILTKKQVKISSVPLASEKDITKDSFNIYISGIDIAGDISLVSRSDVNMIMTVNPTTHQILLTSIPRDYYVQLHGTTGYRDKLTHSGIYGINMTTSTIEDLLNIGIDYYIRVNFTTLTNVVDIMGGIDVYSDTAFRAWTNSSCTYQVGRMHLDGKCALAYARERYAYEGGDRHRIKNQQDVAIAILNKALTSKNLILKYQPLLNTLENSFQTNIPLESIYHLINLQLETMPSWKIDQISLDGYDSSDYTYTYSNQRLYVMEPNKSTITNASKKIKKVEEEQK